MIPQDPIVHPAFPVGGEHAIHCTLVAVNINGFGDHRRTGSDQQYLRRSLRSALDEALAFAGVPRELCWIENRGDGALIVVSSAVPAGLLLDDALVRLGELLRGHNRRSAELVQIRLRMALHAGYVYFDEFGVSGTALVHLYRLLEAPAFRNAFGSSVGDLGLAVSNPIYDEVVREARGGIDPDEFSPLLVELKETKATCWVNVKTRPVSLARVGSARPNETAVPEQSRTA